MKIGILTFHNTLNYGSFLQTLGLYKAVCDLGYDCNVIDYGCKAIEEAEFPNFHLESFHPRKIAKYLLYTRKKKVEYDNFQADLRKYMKLSERYTSDDISSANDKYDAFLVGSDILWDLKLTGNDKAYLLDFVKDSSKKYAFSTSVGAVWNDETVKNLKGYILDFKRIAVREESSARWLREKYPEKDIQAVCDPTMLHNSEYWSKLADNGNIRLRFRYVIVYFPSDDIVRDAKEYAKKYGLKVVCVGFHYKYRGMKHILPLSVCDWLSLMKHSEAVFTGSYHGFLFSLYLNKRVFVYYRSNKGHNIRMSDLMEKLDLKQVCTYGDSNRADMDYAFINRKIEEWRNESLEILKDYWDSDE